MYPCVTVDLVQRHGVAVVFLVCSSPNNNHGVFDQGRSVKETGQGLCGRERRHNKNRNNTQILILSKSLGASYLIAL